MQHLAHNHARFHLLVKKVMKSYRSAVNCLRNDLVFTSSQTPFLIPRAGLALKAHRPAASSPAQTRLPHTRKQLLQRFTR